MRGVFLGLTLAACCAGLAAADTTVTLLGEGGDVGGFIRSDATNTQGGEAVPGADPRVGDRGGSDNLTYRGFLSFDLGAVPAGAAIVAARLEVHQVADLIEPTGSFGAPVVDATVGHFGMGPDLESADYADNSGVAASVAALAGGAVGDAYVYTGDLDSGGVAVIEAAIQGGGRDRVQLRLRFEVYTDSDLEEDQLRLHGGGAPEDLRPRLVIVYASPSGGA